MTGLLIGAAVAVVAAIALTVLGQNERKKYQAFLLTETSTTGTLRELHAAAAEAAGQNSFAEIVELEGTAEAGPRGLLTSELTQTECIWYRQRVTRHYERQTRDSDGNRRMEKKEDVVSDNISKQEFVLRDAEGEITIVPNRIQAAQKILDRFDHESQQGGSSSIGIGSITLNLGSNRDGQTTGYQKEEWVLTPGTRIYVRGEAIDRSGALEVRGPKGAEKLVISTRSEDEILAGHKQSFWLYSAGSAGCVVLAIALALFAVLR